MSRRKKQRIGLCHVCGQNKILTKDHIPPDNLFLKPKPSNMITVFTCEVCNGGTKLDDEYFRIYITAGAVPKTPLGNLWDQKVVGSTLARSAALKKIG